MSTDKLKSRRMWANYKTATSHPRVFRSAADCQGDNEWTEHAHVAVPVIVIPLAGVASLVEKAAASVTDGPHHDMVIARRDARRVLTAIGVLPRPRKKGRK